MGFGQEIRDFLGAAQSTYKLLGDQEKKSAETKYTNTQEEKMRKEMDDPIAAQQAEANLAYTKARTGNIGFSQRNSQSLLDQARQQTELIRQGPANNYRPAGVSTTAPPTSAPDQQPFFDPRRDAAPPPAVGEGNPYGYARGGLVRKFADGGLADDDEEDDAAPPPMAQPAIGGAPPPAMGGGTSDATDISAQSRPKKGGVPIPISRAQAMQGISDAQKYGVGLMGGNGAVPGSSRQRGLKAYAQGAGAASPDEMVYLYRKIDPDGSMPESQRNMLAIGALYDYKKKTGDPQGAARAAFQALQYQRVAARNYAALGVAAMQGGEIEPALKLFMKSYANIPDGNDMKLSMGKNGMVNYEVTGPDGKKQAGGLVPPDKVMGAAMGIASGAGFDEALMEAASGMPGSRGGAIGGRQKKAAATDDSPVGIGSEKGNITPDASAKIRDENREAVNNFVAKQNKLNDKTTWYGGGSKKEVTEQETGTLNNLLYHLRRNNDVTPEEGISAIQKYITAPASEKEGKPAFKLIKDDENKTRTLQFNDGQSYTMPASDYAAFATARGEAIRQRQESADKARDDAAKPKSNVMGAIADYATSPAPSHAARTGNQAPTGPYNPRVGQYGQPTAPSPDEIPPAAVPTAGALPAAPPAGAPNYNPRMGGGRGAIPASPPPNTPYPPYEDRPL